MGKTTEEFKSALSKGRWVGEEFLKYLIALGQDVYIAPYPDDDSRQIDIADIIRRVKNKDGVIIEQRIELKQKVDMEFQSVKSFPFYDIIVDEQRKVDLVHDIPLLCYIIFNKSFTKYFKIMHYTKKYWYPDLKFDKKEHKQILFCMCPVKYSVLTEINWSIVNNRLPYFQQ